jgi:hypothetical protein
MPSKREMSTYIEQAKIVHQNRFDYSLIKNLPKRDTKVRIICPTHGEFEQSFHKHLSGDACKKCTGEKLGKERIERAKQKFKQEAQLLHRNKYDYSKSIYVSAKDNIIIICATHGEFEQTPNKHLGGGGCKKCSIENTRIRLSIPWNVYKENLEKIHNNIYDYSKVIWNGSDNDIHVICNLHGDFIIRAQDHKNGRGCQKCSKENRIQYNKHNTEIFVEKAIRKWGDVYDYSKVDYKGSNDKVIIICKKHGEFEQLPPTHLNSGCGSCGRETNKRNLYLKERCKNEFISKANVIHKNTYEYLKTVYTTVITKITITCKIHGDFSMSPNNHLRGQGCPACGREQSNVAKLKGFDEYECEFMKLYGDKYDYSSVLWEGGSRPITVVCKRHGDFQILPYLHKIGKECQKCSNQHSGISMSWLLYMGVRYSTEIQHAQNRGEFIIPDTRYKADGYAESINTIFEFHGDFWHGNPKLYNETAVNPRTNTTYGSLYESTVKKSNTIKEKGFELIEIWEHDWKLFIKTVITLQSRWKLRRVKNNIV